MSEQQGNVRLLASKAITASQFLFTPLIENLPESCHSVLIQASLIGDERNQDAIVIEQLFVPGIGWTSVSQEAIVFEGYTLLKLQSTGLRRLQFRTTARFTSIKFKIYDCLTYFWADSIPTEEEPEVPAITDNFYTEMGQQSETIFYCNNWEARTFTFNKLNRSDTVDNHKFKCPIKGWYRGRFQVHHWENQGGKVWVGQIRINDAGLNPNVYVNAVDQWLNTFIEFENYCQAGDLIHPVLQARSTNMQVRYPTLICWLDRL